MVRQKESVKPKNFVRLRNKKLANGNKSLYLDIYRDGVRSYEFLKMYLIPEKNNVTARQQNTPCRQQRLSEAKDKMR